MTRAVADLFFTNYNGNIMGLAWVYWRIYSLRVEQYIPRRFAPLDILHNPSGVYYPIYPCQVHYIITIPMLFFIYRDRNSRRDKLIYSYMHHFLFPFLNGLKIVFTIYCYQAQEKRDKMMVCHYQLWTGLMIHEPKNTKKRA